MLWRAGTTQSLFEHKETGLSLICVISINVVNIFILIIQVCREFLVVFYLTSETTEAFSRFEKENYIFFKIIGIKSW